MAKAIEKGSSRRPPSVAVQARDETVDVHAFARHYVQVILANEGIVLTPTRLAEAS